MSVGMLGINSPSLVPCLDTNNSHISHLKKLQSRFLSSQSSWQSTKYEVPVDPIIFNMCNDYMCSTAKKKLDMGSKFSHISCGVPSGHYEIKKPAVNIIGGYVGAKSQQNRENQNYFAIHEILADLLPGLLSENSLRAEDFPEFQPERTFCKMADFKIEAEMCLPNFTFEMEEKVDQPILMKSESYSCNACPSRPKGAPTAKKCGHHHGTVHNALPVANSNVNSPTYASVASTSAMSSKLHEPTANHTLATNKTLKGSNESRSRKNRRRKRKKKINKTNCADTNQPENVEIIADEPNVNAENGAHLVVNDEHFPSICEKTTRRENCLSEIVQDVSRALTTKMDDFINQCASLQSNLCSYDEVDSPHSTNYSCGTRESTAHSKVSNFVCQNNSIAFIMNGNDELSDTDSDWSCENEDSFHDEVWDSFREDFECFQNIFMFESFYPNRTNVDEDGDCELQDEELCVYINQFENDTDLHAGGKILAARLKEVNQRWDSAMKDVVLDEKRTKVQFAPDNFLVEVHCFESSLEEIQSESWENYQLDRCRFRNRVKALEPVISPYLDSIHRQKVWDRLSFGKNF